MKPTEWTGTPAEWDAELTARMNRLVEANFTAGSRSVRYVATATMPPRPVAPPSVVTASGWTVTWDGAQFKAERKDMLPYRCDRSHQIAFLIDATEAEHDAIRALRDGPTARYEVCGYEHWRGNKYVQTFHVSDTMTAESCKQSVQFEIIQTTGGGTAHAIYKRVGGAGCERH